MPERSDRDILADLGVEPLDRAKPARSPREARIIAGFEDIQKFVADQGFAPQHGADRDIFERLYAVRLDRLRDQPDCIALLKEIDHQRLLADAVDALPGHDRPAAMDDDTLLAALGVSQQPPSAMTELRHVRSVAERRPAEEIAARQPCADFPAFEPLLAAVKADLATGARRTRPLGRRADLSEIAAGRFFVVEGVTAYVAEAGPEFVNDSGNRDRRLRVVYDNGTESNLLARSLQRALTQDPTGRRITEPDAGPLFDDELTVAGTETGTIYVLRSRSQHPYISAHRDLIHKIGVTGSDVAARLLGAERDPTFLMAPVEVVATFRLFDVDRVALENLLHRFFAPARLDLSIDDRLGEKIKPREWFLVPLSAIGEAVERIVDGSLQDHEYRPDEAAVVRTP